MPEDLIAFAARKGLLDEAAARAALPPSPGARALADSGLLAPADLATLLAEYESHLLAPELPGLRERARSDLAKAGEFGAARALEAYLEDRSPDAVLLFEEAHAREPNLEEPYEWLARLAETHQAREQWYTKGIEVDRGYLPFWWGRAGARLSEARRRAGRGEADAAPLFEAAIEDYTAAIGMDETQARSLMGRGQARWRWGDYLKNRGQDPSAQYRGAIDEDFARAIELEPDSAAAYTNLGIAHKSLGQWRASRGEDPKGSYEAAIEACQAALARNPKQWEAHANEGLLYRTMGRWPEAPAAFEAAAAINPTDPRLQKWADEARREAAKGEEY